jgi:molybdenum cofactor biosynthesis enzyme MoaA
MKYTIRTFDNTPNFSIVVPNNCGANCEFCFDNDKVCKLNYMPFKKWFNELQKVVKTLPEKFKQVSVTGGEPTLLDQYTEFPELMEFLAGHFEKIVVTTNAQWLYQHIAYMSLATYVNISYHGINNIESNAVFRADISPSTETLKKYIAQLKALGTKVRIQRVLRAKYSLDAIFWICSIC